LELFRGVNKYIDFNTGQEYLWRGRAYDKPGPAKGFATLHRSKTRRVDGVVYEYVETWCERATEWTRI
jgi:hypothetical protein